jgi:hypothetical protein
MNILLDVAILALTGTISGFASGFFGIGGGFLMVPVQYWLLASGGINETLATRIAFGTGLAVMVPTMLSGAYGHHRKGVVNWPAAIPMGIAAVFGGLAGGTLASWLPGMALRIIFSLALVIMSMRMLWEVRDCHICDIRGSPGAHISLGLLIGIISGLAGIGGGVVLVPILVVVFRYPMRTAVGTSSACLIFSSAGAVTAYALNGWGVAGLPPYSLGYVNLIQWAALAATTIPLALVGVRFCHVCSERKLRIIFAGIMIFIGVLMLMSL